MFPFPGPDLSPVKRASGVWSPLISGPQPLSAISCPYMFPVCLFSQSCPKLCSMSTHPVAVFSKTCCPLFAHHVLLSPFPFSGSAPVFSRPPGRRRLHQLLELCEGIEGGGTTLAEAAEANSCRALGVSGVRGVSPTRWSGRSGLSRWSVFSRASLGIGRDFKSSLLILWVGMNPQMTKGC